jgi:predicted  nucleic acid-binding Zn-ribbon protein
MSKHIQFEEQYDISLKSLKQIHTDHVKYLQQQLYEYKKKYEQASASLEEATQRIVTLEKKLEESNEARNIIYKKYHDIQKHHANLNNFKQSIVGMLDKDQSVAGGSDIINNITNNIPNTHTSAKKANVTFASNIIDSTEESTNRYSPTTTTTSKLSNFINDSQQLIDRSINTPDVTRTPHQQHSSNKQSPITSNHKYEYNLERITRSYTPTKSKHSNDTLENTVTVEQLYQQTKKVLSQSEFTDFARNIRKLNMREQSVDETLDNVQQLFGPERQYLFRQLCRIIKRSD